MSSTSIRRATKPAGAKTVQAPPARNVAAAAVLAEAASITADAQAGVAAEAAISAAQAAVKARQVAANAVSLAEAAAAETAAAMSAAVSAEASLSAATTAMAPACAGGSIAADRTPGRDVTAALRTATDAAAALAAAVAGQDQATRLAAAKVALAVTVAAAAAAAAAAAEAAAVEDAASAAAVVASDVAASLATAVHDEVTAAATAAAEVANSLAAAVEDEVLAAALVAAAVASTRATLVTATMGTQATDVALAGMQSPAPPPAEEAEAVTAPLSTSVDAPVTTTLTGLTTLLDGLDDAVKVEWEAYLSAPIAPITLPGIEGDGQLGTGQRGIEAPLGLLGLARDLTLARRIELALSESEERFQVAFEHAPVATLLATCDGHRLVRFLKVNPALCRLTGYSEAELLELDPRALCHPEDEARRFEGVDDIFAAADDRQHLQRWMHAAGHSMWVRTMLRPVLDADGSLEFVVGQVEDVTSRRRVDGALRQSEKQYRLAFDSAPIASMHIRLTGAVAGGLIRANDAACRLTGYTEAELLAWDVEALFGQTTSTQVGIHRLPAGDYEAEKRYRHADGHTFLARMQGRIIPGENGQADTLIAYLQEIPEHGRDRAPDARPAQISQN